jgi:hypothetical protein
VPCRLALVVCTVSIIYHINPFADTNQVGGTFAVVGAAEKRYGTEDTLRNDQYTTERQVHSITGRSLAQGRRAMTVCLSWTYARAYKSEL